MDTPRKIGKPGGQMVPLTLVSERGDRVFDKRLKRQKPRKGFRSKIIGLVMKHQGEGVQHIWQICTKTQQRIGIATNKQQLPRLMSGRKSARRWKPNRDLPSSGS